MPKSTALQDETEPADRSAAATKKRARSSASGDRKQAAQAPGLSRPSRWLVSPLAMGMAGSLLLWAALPPWNLWSLAWIAPIPWLALVQREKFTTRRPYLALWAAGFVHWMLLLEGMTNAHPALYAGWAALSFYLALYLPLFVGLSRVAVHRVRVPLIVAAPVIWTGLELARGHLLTGCSLALLGHTQVGQTWLIQLADLFGAYGVSFMVMLVAACILQSLPLEFDGSSDSRRFKLAPLAIAIFMLAAAAGYGWFSRSAPSMAEGEQPILRVALIQESIDTIFEANPQRDVQTYEKYLEQSLVALEQHGPVDLVVWPESMLAMPDQEMQMTFPEIIIDGEIKVPDDFPDADVYRHNAHAAESIFRGRALETLEQLNRANGASANPVYVLGGGQAWRFGPQGQQIYNSATLLDPRAQTVDRYYKMHPVMFGEYIPLAGVFPWIYEISPMKTGLTPGDGPQSMQVAGIRISPSICFESTVPHLIRRQVAELRRQGEDPDVLINLTNDGWFFGSGILDLQLHCAAFRAIENRRPMLVAANTGISAWIDADGRILQRGPRQQADTIIAEISPHNRRTWYSWWGDAPAGLCLLLTLLVAAVGIAGKWRPSAAKPAVGE